MDLNDWLSNLDFRKIQVLYCKRLNQHSTFWNLETHSHRHLELMFFLNGKASIDISGKIITPNAYDLVAYLPLCEHQESVDLQKRVEMICILIDCPPPPEGVPEYFLLHDINRSLGWLFSRFEEEWRTYSPHGKVLLNCYLEAILLNVSRLLKQDENPGAAISISHMIDYINENYQSELTVEFLARTFHVSPSYLHKVFRKQLDTSPIQYINSIKINEAQYLLSSSDLTIVQIAEYCGFSDSRYFSRVFKTATGISPSQYRAKTRN
ncbi:MAG TPA: AraC family transcriptional regulator [Clostridia bacterium]|nr:AraC family transcriptional regulator [Clostridia bacterium]